MIEIRRTRTATSGARPAPEGDAGFVSIIVLGLVGALLLIFAFAYDGGRALTEKQRATDIAAQAARAGADAIVPTNGASTNPQIDPTRARTAAQNYLSAVGTKGTVTATTAQVSVTVTVIYHTQLLGMIFITSLTEHGSATAEPIPGLIAPA